MAPLLIGGIFVALVCWERCRALRTSSEPPLLHDARNLAIAAAGAFALELAERPVTSRLTRFVARRRWGLVPQLGLRGWPATLTSVLLLDYTLYLWHVLTHRVPTLWRLHQPHHVDLDLSASTALRFHFFELLASVPWRAAQVLVIGVTPAALAVWQRFLFCSIVFHHSNARLPYNTERWLVRVVVTPRMHGIHHSWIAAEANSNWSSGLTLWDWLHGTLRLNVPQQQITIGVPAYRDPAGLTLAKVLAMPVVEQRPTWQLRGGDIEPRRAGYDRGSCELLP